MLNPPEKISLKAGLIFIDPPYKINNLIKVIDNWVSSGCIDEEAIYILEKNSTNNIQLAKLYFLKNFKFCQINFQYLLNLTL